MTTNSSANYIEPCPFCGSSDIEIQQGTEDREGIPVNVCCVDCGASGPWIYTRSKTILTDVSACAKETGWNERA